MEIEIHVGTRMTQNIYENRHEIIVYKYILSFVEVNLKIYLFKQYR